MKNKNSSEDPEIECLYKDVVIIGNGPSGITLSYMLAGHWPYWNPQDIVKHPDELLRARLMCSDPNKSLIEQDLEQLAEGLEGRSTNPVSLLLDCLQNPCADIGLEVPSMLHYRYEPDKKIDHVVLGAGPPGGSWHRMDPDLRTLSLSAWMSLPNLNFNTWIARQCLNRVNDCASQTQKKSQSREFNWWHCFSNRNATKQADTAPPTSQPNELEISLCDKKSTFTQSTVPKRVLSVRRQVSREVQTRALVSDVAQYYESYVKEMHLEQYFHNNTQVTSVRPVLNAAMKNGRWRVRGIQANGKPFAYNCRNVVLANGASDLANRLGACGEESREWVKHDLPALVSALKQIPDAERSQLKPVMVIGAGLSAADAITICRSSSICVVHVYRNRSAGLDKMLPETVYPEYHEVHKMMRDSVSTYDLYSPYPEYKIVQFITGSSDDSSCHQVVLQKLNTGELTTIEVSYCAILIGFRPDLRFLDVSNRKIADLDSFLRNNCLFVVPYNLLGRKIAWIKNLCVKCKHLSLCERSRKYGQVHQSAKRISQCGCTNDDQCGQNHNNNSITTNSNKDRPKESIGEPEMAGLGEDETKPIDCKANPIKVDKYTNEIMSVAAKGLFAMGPLVGDNFIRFIPGGALAITSALWKQR